MVSSPTPLYPVVAGAPPPAGTFGLWGIIETGQLEESTLTRRIIPLHTYAKGLLPRPGAGVPQSFASWQSGRMQRVLYVRRVFPLQKDPETPRCTELTETPLTETNSTSSRRSAEWSRRSASGPESSVALTPRSGVDINPFGRTLATKVMQKAVVATRIGS